MKVEDIEALRRGALLYRIIEVGGTPRIVEYRYDFEPDELSANALDRCAVRVEKTTFAGRPVPSGQGAIERVSGNALVEEFGLTPGEAAALYVQGKVRAELRAQDVVREAAEAREAARVWFASWHGADRPVR